MTSRKGASPPLPYQRPGRYMQSPRTQVAMRLPPTVPVLMGQRRSLVDANAACLAAGHTAEELSPKIAEIQGRVDELVRRYDEAVAAVEWEQESDHAVPRRPKRWKVGDVLVATHRALARTSTHTDRFMATDFPDELEAGVSLGSEAVNVGSAFVEAEKQAARRHERLVHIHDVLQAHGMAFDDHDDDEKEGMSSLPSSTHVESQLRSTVQALHRETSFMALQLQEAHRVQQELRLKIEEHAQKLSKAQTALETQSDDLRLAREQNEQAAATANLLLASWREKLQAAANIASEAEARVRELEATVRAQSEEMMKQQAKAREVERMKEMEAARRQAEIKATAAAHAAALAEAESAARRLQERLMTRESADDRKRGLEDRIQGLEEALRALKTVNQGLEEEKAELVQRVRDLQLQVEEQLKLSRPSLNEVHVNQEEHALKFTMRLREAPSRSKRQEDEDSKPVLVALRNGGGDLVSGESSADDNDKEVDQVERDEREVNQAIKTVVATVFPVLSSLELQADLDQSIARYEDPIRSPLCTIQSNHWDGPRNGELMPPLGMGKEDENELGAMRLQYMENLQTYKRLVVEQYERHQAIESDRHRREIDGLLQLIQTKFHAELARREERMKCAKKSLKVLYKALRQHSGRDFEPQNKQKELPTRTFHDATPLRTLLRAAILSMSALKTTILPPYDTRTNAIAAAMTIYPVIQDDEDRESVSTEDTSSQTDLLPAPLQSIENLPLSKELHLEAGIPISSALLFEVHSYLPNLPRVNYHLSDELRLVLFHEVVRFLAAFETADVRENDGQVHVIVGSPRNTPELRRKAFEAIERRRNHKITCRLPSP